MRLFMPCFVAHWLYPDAIFSIGINEKLLCLTFDDGPDPDSTPKLLEVLDRHTVKALFFCSGRAAEKYPDLVNRIRSKGHVIGNHGYNHLNGWITSLNKYVRDVENAAPFTSSGLFRPPFGRLRFGQYRKLKETYRIVFWDIMPYDFDISFGIENSLRILKKKIRPGSIIVFHDTSCSFAETLIDEFLTSSVNSGYRFELPEFCRQ
jgi:peptidoglycan/xylan/chitin deacetylase (PgdA/CDA1 family)